MKRVRKSISRGDSAGTDPPLLSRWPIVPTPPRQSRSGRSGWLLVALVLGTVWLGGERVRAQPMTQVTTPYHVINDSFYESLGFGGFGINRMGPNGGWFFNTGPAGSAPPPFGGYDPAADARFGARIGPFNFNGLAGTGSSRSHVMQAPTITLTNGVPGFMFDGSMVPFVTGIVPVVGYAPVGTGIPPAGGMNGGQQGVSLLEERLVRMQQEQALAQAAAAGAEAAAAGQAQRVGGDAPPLVLQGPPPAAASPSSTGVSSTGSSANHGDISVAEIRAQQAAQEAQLQNEIQVRIEKARGHEQAGELGIAKIYYRQAAERAEGRLKQQLLEHIQQLSE
jgi:hypothetical protein